MSKEVYVSINKIDGGMIATRQNGHEAEQKIFTNLNKAIAWIKEVLVEDKE